MNIKSLIIVLCIAGITSCSFHTYTKKEVIKVTKKSAEKKHTNIIIEDDDTVLKVLLRDSNYQKLDEIFYFNNDGTQAKFSLIASCDSCFQKNLSETLNSKIYKWKKQNDTTYFSRHSLRSILNVHTLKHSYDIVNYNRKKK